MYRLTINNENNQYGQVNYKLNRLLMANLMPHHGLLSLGQTLSI